MASLSAYLKSCASGRAVVAAVLFALLIYFVQTAVLVPQFRAVTGFPPFDLQFPLTRYMIAIQLGAYDGRAAAAYLPFLLADQILSFAAAWALMLLWAWLFRVQPNPVFDFLERGAVILIPVYALLCDIGENLAFSRLIGGLEGGAYVHGIRVAVFFHGVRGAFLDLQVILTIAFVILFLLTAVRKGRPESDAGGGA